MFRMPSVKSSSINLCYSKCRSQTEATIEQLGKYIAMLMGTKNILSRCFNVFHIAFLLTFFHIATHNRFFFCTFAP